MSTDTTPIEISNNPELLRLAEEVEATKKPRLLKRDNIPVALLTPVKKKQTSLAKSKTIQETLALAGAWGDRDWNVVEAELERRSRNGKDEVDRISQAWLAQEKRTRKAGRTCNHHLGSPQ